MDTYQKKVRCSNCSYEGIIDVEKGKRIDVSNCPQCGLKDLQDPPQKAMFVPAIENNR